MYAMSIHPYKHVDYNTQNARVARFPRPASIIVSVSKPHILASPTHPTLPTGRRPSDTWTETEVPRHTHFPRCNPVDTASCLPCRHQLRALHCAKILVRGDIEEEVWSQCKLLRAIDHFIHLQPVSLRVSEE